MALKKLSGGWEDLTFGMDTENQQRQTGVVVITQINGSQIPYTSTVSITAELERQDSVDTALSNNIENHKVDQDNPHNVTVDDVGGTTQVYVDIQNGLQDIVTGNINSRLVGHTANLANPHDVTKSQLGLSNVDNTSDADKPISDDVAADLALRYTKADHVQVSTGATDAGKPIILSNTGEIDLSMLGAGLVFVGMFTPTAGNEYPDNTGYISGHYWGVIGVDPDLGYTMTTGDLIGEVVFNGDALVTGVEGWGVVHIGIVPEDYYRLDGTVAISADFAGGGKQLKNIAPATEAGDAVELSQIAAFSDDFVAKAGDTMTGQLLVDGSPIAVQTESSNLFAEIDVRRADGINEFRIRGGNNALESRIHTIDIDGTTILAELIFNDNGNVSVTTLAPIDAANLTRKDYVDNQTYNRNLIPNGDFAISQEHGEADQTRDDVGGGSWGYVADLFKSSQDAGGKYTISSEEIGYSKSKRYTVNRVTDDLSGEKACNAISYAFEGQDLYREQGKNITLSFKFRSNVAGIYSIAFINDTGTNKESYITEFTSLGNNTVENISATILLQTSWLDTLAYDGNPGIAVRIGNLNEDTMATSTLDEWTAGNYVCSLNNVNWMGAVDNYIEVAELQVERGNLVTEFENVSGETQRRRVNRYYYRGQLIRQLNPTAWEAGTVSYPVGLPNTMRAEPIIDSNFDGAINGTDGGSCAGQITAAQVEASGDKTISLQFIMDEPIGTSWFGVGSNDYIEADARL